jgi:hypothetical protein
MNPSVGLGCRHPGDRHPSNGAREPIFDVTLVKWITRYAFFALSGISINHAATEVVLEVGVDF